MLSRLECFSATGSIDALSRRSWLGVGGQQSASVSRECREKGSYRILHKAPHLDSDRPMHTFYTHLYVQSDIMADDDQRNEKKEEEKKKSEDTELEATVYMDYRPGRRAVISSNH